MQQSLDFISGMQSDPANNKSDRMNPVLSFNCDGDIRTKKDSHIQSLPPSLTDQQDLPMQLNYTGVNVGKSQSSNSSSFVPGLPPYSQIDSHGQQVLNTKNHSNVSGNNHIFESPYHQSHDGVMPSPTHTGNTSSSKQSVNPQFPSAAMPRNQNVHVNSLHSVNSPNHIGLSGSEYSAADSGQSLAVTHPLSAVNDSSSKVNYGGANQSETVPLVKLEKRNATLSNDVAAQKPIKVIILKFPLNPLCIIIEYRKL